MVKASFWPKRRLTMGSNVPTATSGTSVRGGRQPRRLLAAVGQRGTGGAVGGDVLADAVQRPVRGDVAGQAVGPKVVQQLVEGGGVHVGEVAVVHLEAR